MKRLYFCGVCHSHHYVSEGCTNSPRTRNSVGIALVALLGLTACGEAEQKDSASTEDSATSEDSGVVAEPSMEDLYGVPWTDNDGDGWAAEEGDCDDNNPDIHPEAREIAGDGVDSNCNGEDDT